MSGRARGRALALFAFMLTGALCNGALASDAAAYPTRSIRLLIPFPPGGGADTLARIVVPRFSDMLGQPWVIDNRGGAAGNIAAATVVNAAPDGHTVLLGFSSVLTVNPSFYKLGYSVEKDLQPLTMLATSQYLLVLHASVPANTLKDFIALAKQKPGSLNYASAGVGSPLHLAAELFKKRAGINLVHLPYNGGGPAAAAVLAGEAQVIFGSVASSIQQVKAGKLKALATTGLKRSKVAPDLPTIAESGFPGFDVGAWYALLVPARTSPVIANRLRDVALKVVAQADVQEAMARLGQDVETSTPQDLATRIKSETAVWAEVIRDAGIKAE